MKGKRLMTAIVTAALFFQGVSPVAAAFGMSNDESILSSAGISIGENQNGSITINDNGSKKIISLSEADGVRTVTIEDEATGKSNHLFFDVETGKVTSDFTGATLYLSSEPESYGDEDVVQRVNQPVRTYTRYQISFAEIRAIFGPYATAANVASLFVGRIGIPALDVALGAAVAAVWILGSVPDDPNGGIYVVTILKRWYDDDGVLYQTQAGIDSAGIY